VKLERWHNGVDPVLLLWGGLTPVVIAKGWSNVLDVEARAVGASISGSYQPKGIKR
jgi:hypothetical protein